MRAQRMTVERLIRIAKGQLEGILRMIEEDRYCMDILNQLLATQKILDRAQREILTAHIGGCLKEAVAEHNADEKLEEIQEYLRRM